MRPLVVSHTGAAGGSNHVVLGLLRHRPADVLPVCVFLDDGPAVASVRQLGVETHLVPAGRSRDVGRVPGVVRALGRLARTRRADVVFAHASKAQLYASLAAAAVRVPSVWYQHEVPGTDRGAPGRSRVLQELAGRLPAQAVICNSAFVAGLHAERWPRASVRTVHPGVEVEDASPHTHSATRSARICVVGRLQRWRRVELALEAMRLVVLEEPGVRLRVVGGVRADVDADYPDALRELAATLGIAHAVEFVGDVADPDGQLAGADVLLHVADREAFGLPLVEALLRGVPVVAPPGGGTAEIVTDGVDGLVVDPTRRDVLAAALLGLVRDPDRRAAMGARGRARALERFDERRTTADVWDVVGDVARAGRGGRRPE